MLLPKTDYPDLVSGESVMESLAKLQHGIAAVSAGKMDPKKLGQLAAEEVLKKSRRAQAQAWPAASQAPGRVECLIIYKQRDGYTLKMTWDVIPSSHGTTVLGFCPTCYQLAPTTVDWRTGSRPAFRDGVIGAWTGNPEADRKLRVWSYQDRDIQVEYDEKGRARLTVGKVIRCKYHSNCGWAVRVERGRAHWVPSTIQQPGMKQSTGPLVLVK